MNLSEYVKSGLSVAPAEVSAKLTRSLSLFHALKVFACTGPKVVVHLLGADYLEAKNPVVQFKPLFTLLKDSGVEQLVLVFVGPNLDDSIDKTERQFMCVGISITFQFSEQLYHEHQQGSLAVADLVVCFNAGVWGYNSWSPTFRSLPVNTPCIVTSYNKFEADDDHDAINKTFSTPPAKLIEWEWSFECNPYASTVTRDSGIKDRPCIENNYWQAFRVKQ